MQHGGHITKDLLGPRGVPVGGGGALPESITDDFSADSGLWLDGDLAAAAMTVSGGKGIWAPTEGSEIHTSANAASDPNGNEANATTGWGTGLTMSVETVDVDTGSYALKGVAPDGTSDRSGYSISNATRGWLLQRCAAKTLIGTSWRVYNTGAALVRPSIDITDTWADYVLSYYKSENASVVSGLWCNAGSADDAALLDNVSCKLLAFGSTLRVQRIYYPSSISVKVWGNTNTHKGVICYQDSNNWVGAVIYSTFSVNSVALLKCAGGAASLVGSVSGITYSAGAALQLVPSADFQTWTVIYDDTTEVNAAAIADFAASGTWYAGLLNTYDAGDTSVIGFDDFSATRIAEAPPF